MSTIVISWILLFAAAQGVFLGLVLASMSRSGGKLNHRLMAALLLVFVIIILDAWASLTGWYWQFPHLLHASIAVPLLIGPLVYLHLRWSLWGTPVTQYDGRHALVFLGGVLLWSPYYALSGAEKLSILAGTETIPWTISAFALVKIVHLLTYLFLSYRMLREARELRPTDTLAIQLARLGNFLALGISLVLALFAIEHLNVKPILSSDTLAAIILTIFVYGLAVNAIRLPLTYVAQAPSSKPRYDGKLLGERERQMFMDKLKEKIEGEHWYKNGDLKLDSLAEVLAMTPHELSQLINLEYATNFSDFLNRHRVEALKQLLHDPEHQHKTVLELAIACGFNSKSALNRAFKKVTGVTPSEFKRISKSDVETNTVKRRS